MMKAMRRVSTAFAVAALTSALACGGTKDAPTTPTPPPTSGPGGMSLGAPAPSSPVGGVTISGLKPSLTVSNSAAAGSVGAVTYQFEVSEMDSFPANSRTSSVSGVAQGGGSTSWVPPSDLIPNFLYYWHARATNGTITTEWSKVETFRTP